MHNHIILMPHVMIKNNGDFHFPSPFFPHLLFLSSHRKATCLLLYEFLLDFILSPGDWEDAGWVMMMLIPFWHFCHWILSASYRTWLQMLPMGMGTGQRGGE